MLRVAPYACLSGHTGEALPDISSYNGVQTTGRASRSRFKTQLIAIRLQKQIKSVCKQIKSVS